MKLLPSCFLGNKNSLKTPKLIYFPKGWAFHTHSFFQQVFIECLPCARNYSRYMRYIMGKVKAGIWAKDWKRWDGWPCGYFEKSVLDRGNSNAKFLSRHLPGNSRVARRLVWLGSSEKRWREFGKVTEGCEGVDGSGSTLSTTVKTCFHSK